MNRDIKWWMWPFIGMFLVAYPCFMAGLFILFLWSFLGEQVIACAGWVAAALLWTAWIAWYHRNDVHVPVNTDLREARIRTKGKV